MIVAMYKINPPSLKETMMFHGDDDTFESPIDKLVSFASVKHSLRLDDKPTCAEFKKDPNAKEVDALTKREKNNKGKTKGKRKSSKSSGESRVECYN